MSLEEACNIDSNLSDIGQSQLSGLDGPGNPVPSTLWDAFKEETRTDETLKAWRELATARDKSFSWDGPLICKETEGPGGELRSLIAVPTRIRKDIMSIAHDQFGHMADKRTRYVISRKFVWPGMAKDVRTWCRSCLVCQRQGKVKPQCAPMCQTPILTEPFSRLFWGEM